MKRFAVGILTGLVLGGLIGARPLGAEGLEVLTNGKVVPDGGSWFVPMGKTYNKVALFSKYPELISLYNRTDAPMTIDDVVLERGEGVKDEELQLRAGDLKHSPIEDWEPVTLEPGKSVSFNVFFYPVVSAERPGKVTITYNGDQTHSFAVSGKGRDSARFWEALRAERTKIFGGPNTDEMVTGMACDAVGNCFFTGFVTQVKDRFAFDLFYARVNADGTLGWAKLWSGPFRDYSPDPGQNGETGGSSGAIDLDAEGFVYVLGSVSEGKSNNMYSGLVLKIDPATGETVWEKAWRPDWSGSLVKHTAKAYALDVSGDTVWVAGETMFATAFVYGLSTSDGSVRMQQSVDPTPGYTDRAYTVRADGRGAVYAAGIAAKIPVVIKLDVSDLGAPRLAWVRTYETGWGSNIGDMDVGPDGDVYVAFDRRGASTHFTFARLAAADGSVAWAKTYGPGRGKNDNCNWIRVLGGDVYVGGRVGLGWYDSQYGDALLLKVARADGAPLWAGFHYSGKGPEVIAEHRVKGAALGKDGALHVLGQVYTGNHNGVRYAGYWYDYDDKIQDERIKVNEVSVEDDGFVALEQGSVRDAAGMREVHDLTQLLVWQDASAKKDGHGPDGELILWKLVP